MISCEEAVRQLWAYVEEGVSAAERAAIEAHLEICLRCCSEVEFVQELRLFLRRTASETVPADVRARLEGLLDQVADGDG